MADDLAAVFIFEGEVNQRLNAELEQLRADGRRSQGRAAAWIVGDGQSADSAIGLDFTGQIQQPLHFFAAAALARHQLIGDDEFMRTAKG